MLFVLPLLHMLVRWCLFIDQWCLMLFVYWLLELVLFVN